MNLLAYIQGNRKGKEAHRIEREAMQDPFLADALDGFDEVEGNHAERITAIRTRLSASARKSNRKIAYIGVAASLLLCVTVGGYFLMQKDEQPLIARNEMVQEEAARVAVPDEKTEEVQAPEEEPVEELNQARTAEDTKDVSPALPPPAAQEDMLAAVNEVVVVEDGNSEQAVTAAVEAEAEVQTEAEQEKPLVAQSGVKEKEPAKLNTPGGGGGQLAMTSTASGKPEPKIGMRAYKKYLKDAMVRSKDGSCAKKKGDVIVEFKIDKAGRPQGITLRKKLCEELDKEAIRLIENGPDWVGDTTKSVILEVKF